MDITMCNGNKCPLKERCERHTGKFDKWWQPVFTKSPIKKDNTCEFYKDNYATKDRD